jgi:hypothetical protein
MDSATESDSTSGHPNAKEIQQEDFLLAFPALTAPVQAEMADGDDERQDGIGENTECYGAHPALLEWSFFVAPLGVPMPALCSVASGR